MKLNPIKVEEIKILIGQGVTQPKIAEQFGVSRSLVSDIATGRVWKQVSPVLSKDQTNNRVLNLEAEVVMLRDERNAMKRQIKTVYKTQSLFQSLVDEMESCVKPYTALPSVFDLEVKSEIQEHLVMHLSDGHHDQVIKPVDCGGLEDHDFRVSCKRAEVYVDTLLKWTQQTLAPTFRFPTLTVLAYGDHTSGEIHKNVERSYYRNQFKNCFGISQLHALMFRDLAPYFNTVNVVYVSGNHGRRSIKKDYNNGPHDNWDYLIAEMARLHCRDIDNLNFIIPESFSVNIDIGGVGFCCFHGDEIRSSMGIPWYGLERKQRRLMALNQATGNRIRYYCCGHFHRPTSLTDIDGELLVNGAWIATDAFIYNACSGYTIPSQLIHGVNSQHGVTWKLAVHLRTPNEKKGPKRYKIDLMN